LNRIALGTAQFGSDYGVANNSGKILLKEARSILKLGKSYGVDILDTAIAYGDSEQNLGQIGVEGFGIITKLPALPKGEVDIADWVRAEVANSLDRMQKKSLYGLLLHRPDELMGPRGADLYRGLESLKNEGKIGKIGVSVYSMNELEELTPRYKLDLVQAPFNLVDRSLVDSGWLAKLKLAGVEVHVRSIFLQGLLLMPRNAIPVKFLGWSTIWDKWHVWLQKNQITAVEACLSYVLSCSHIDRVIVGVDTQDQLLEIVNAANREVLDSYPDIKSDSVDLINPANWGAL